MGPSASERARAVAARAVAALPHAAKRRIAGAPIVLDGLELDLDTQVLLKLAERDPRPALSGLTPVQARAELLSSARMVAGAPIRGVEIGRTSVVGAAGPLDARVYTPLELRGERSGPLIVFYHGGGWVAGDLDTHDQPCRLLARCAGARVISVAYRLAPEHPFPAPVEDALSAFRDIVARAAEFGADPARVAVAGDSAGGHLSAVTCQLAAADGGPAPAFQLLIYPVTDLNGRTASRDTFAEGFLLTKDDMAWYEAQFLAAGGELSDPRVSPLLAQDMSALAPAMVVTAGFDPLRDEGEAYAHRLREAGVRTILRRHPGFVHGFANIFTAAEVGREAIAEMGGAVRAALTG